MVQQEVRKKTRIYGTVAALSAMVLVGLIFVFGSTPSLIPPAVSGMRTFADEAALRAYIVANTKGAANYVGGPLDSKFFVRSGDLGGFSFFSPAPPAATGAESSTQSNSYSTTNIQVAGVDEADIVKNDGSYLYVASNDYSNGQNYVYILKADPQDPRVIARIALENNTYLAGMYISQDSSKLVIVGSQYGIIALDEPVYVGGNGAISIYQYFENNVKTFMSVYDVSDKVHPVLARNITLSGSYFNSRMIGDYVYAVVSQPAYVLEDVVPLPRVYAGTAVSEIAPAKIYYSETANYADVANNYFTYTTFIGLNVKDSGQELTNMTVLMGGASTMYASLSNIYVTYPTWSEGGEYTSIYRISVNEDALNFEAKGSVPGYVLNQYSMDEYNGNFRLATTSWKDTTRNAVYVLNSNLTAIGEVRLENAEVRETIQSVRFMGDKAYIVTFEQKDPFFVLDMSNPEAPKVSGKLEIPGFSSYLHPYDENHVIGLGREGNYVKLSLFDVSNVNAPTEIAKLIVDGEYTDPSAYDNSTGWPTNLFDYSDSQALNEPKAFLFRQEDGLLVIPMSTLKYGEIVGKDTTYWGQTGYWQGAYVFKLTLAGFDMRGGVTHQENMTTQYYPYDLNVNRALYIGNTLYTMSNGKVLLNNLDTLTPIAEVNLR